MAYAKGVEAVLKIGSDSIAQVSSWSVDVTQDTVECSNIGSTTKTYESVMVGWSASVDVFFDADDSTAQAGILTAGGIPAGAQSAVTASFYYEGETTGDKYFTGSGFVTGISPTQEANGLMTATISIQGTGALSQSTA
tara:strand:+ start:347 stop:760 length:414 start_codon:yes stop_codon:yes gene_type:complete